MNREELNKTQQMAVETTDGPVMILAGAGSGKTRTLIAKISYLINNRQVAPYNILALTFSNKAAKEMKYRIQKETLLHNNGALQVLTFHSFCARILRQEADCLGLSKNFVIYDKVESKTVAKSILEGHRISFKEIPPVTILQYVDNLKNKGHYIGRESTQGLVNEADVFYAFYLEYENKIHLSNAIDFGGLIVGVIELFEKYPSILEKYRNKFRYILVDEYQDTNRAQFDLIKKLSAPSGNICVVGDEDQSIYSWRGADIHNLLDFEKDFPKTKVIKLEQNYRSSRNIIKAAGHIIANNTLRSGKEMWTENIDGEKIKIVELSSDREEAMFITNEINYLMQKGIPGQDIAIFYRANSQSRLLEDYLRTASLHYRIIGGMKFYERKEIKDFLAYLRIIVNTKDSLSLTRVINVPARGIGPTTLRRFEGMAIQNGRSLWETIVQFTEKPSLYSEVRMARKVQASLSEFVEFIKSLQEMHQTGASPFVLFKKAWASSGYGEFLRASKDFESQARIENLEELGNAIRDYEKNQKRMGESPTLFGFLETVSLDAQTEMEEQGGQQTGPISLMTVHSAKGLEFPYVFVAGVEENMFPTYKSLEKGALGIEEERRLFYVAMTRAMQRLYLIFAQGRMLFGTIKYNGPSRFLGELPKKYYHWIKKKESINYYEETF